MTPDTIVPIVGIISTFVLFPLTIGAVRWMWKRTSEPSRPTLAPDTSRRLEQMQQSIDAMAIEIERISEGQRFVTKVLAEREKASALPSGSGRNDA